MSLPTPTLRMDPSILKEMDGPLVELAQRSDGDLRKLMYAFFSFLNRRTDFYCIPHNDDLNGKEQRLGFKEGDAEKLLLAAFRQFPLRKMPKQNNNVAAKDPPGQQGATTASATAASDDAETTNKTTTTKATKSTTKESTTTTTIIRKAVMEDPMENTRFTDEGKQVPVGNGGSTTKFRWTQTLEEVTIILAPTTTTGTTTTTTTTPLRGKDLNVSIKTGSISVKRKEAPTKNNDSDDDDSDDDDNPPTAMLEGQLVDKIQTDESTWSIEGGVLLLTLQKAKRTWWDSALVGDPKIDTSLVDSRRRIDEYDESTQGAIRRILFDERQHRLGAPSSDQIMRREPQQQQQQQQRGINPIIIPPLPDGVEFIDKETLDKAELLDKMNISRSEA